MRVAIAKANSTIFQIILNLFRNYLAYLSYISYTMLGKILLVALINFPGI